MDGIHVIEVTYTDGRSKRVACPCDWCDIWRALKPDVDRVLSAHMPEVRPDWLAPAGVVVQ